MILLVVMTSLLILGATFYQYYSQSDDYNLRRLERKETQVKNHLSYILDRDDAFNTIGEKQLDFYEIFESIALIHKVEYALFSLEGVPYFYSYAQTTREHVLGHLTAGQHHWRPYNAQMTGAIPHAQAQRQGQTMGAPRKSPPLRP